MLLHLVIVVICELCGMETDIHDRNFGLSLPIPAETVSVIFRLCSVYACIHLFHISREWYS